ncbi:MAG: plastocyanin/azurin family copper-binding protein, partial [Saprospiraceae bacterium]|nr:plastocyanin/azurin family copper-binding protein [Saprospiraceae bacterium]
AVLEEDGAGFSEIDGWNMLASADEWVSPVHAEVGPDGALWVLDWYNFIIQHNPTPPGFENGPGNAHINPLRDKKHGRIYKIIYNQAAEVVNPVLDRSEPTSLIAGMNNNNMLWRLHAQRLIVEEGHTTIKEDLIEMIKDESMDQIGINPGAIHALYALDGLGLISHEHPDVLDVVYNAFEHPSAGVRKSALSIAPRDQQTLTMIMDHYNLADRDAKVRLAAILALGEMPTSDTIGQILFDLSRDNSVLGDEWLARAAYGVAVQHKEAFSQAIYNDNASALTQDHEENPIELNGADPSLNVNDWGDIKVPSRWSQTGVAELEQFDGVVWHRTTIDLSEEQARSEVRLHLGIVDDTDDTYFNGVRIGGMIRRWDGIRDYSVPRNIIRAGTNTIAVKVADGSGGGGIRSPSEDVYLQVGDERLTLAGNWKYKVTEVFRSGQSAFAGGKGIVDLFLENYGPFAMEFTADLQAKNQEYDRKIILQTIPGQNKFDKSEIEAGAGERILIEFTNNDLSMQHNIVLAEPGSLDIIGRISDKMTETNQNRDDYVPPISQVLASTGLVNPGTSVELYFDVPHSEGDYVFVCTFPGHWLSMNGILKVRKQTI